MRPLVLTIAGSDSGGGAGIQVDLEVLTLLGCHGLSVLTALTAQNSLGVLGVEPVSPGFLRQQLRAVFEDFDPQVVKTGMLWSVELMEVVIEELLRSRPRVLVVDPVLVAKGGHRLLKEEAENALKERLFPLATVITPNLPEAEALTGIRATSRGDLPLIAEALKALGPKAVLIKGGHLEGEPWDLLMDEEGFFWLEGERVPQGEVHGTGCAFSAALAGFLAKGLGLREAAVRAKAYVTEGIRRAKSPGKGRAFFDPLSPLEGDLSRWEVVKRLKAAYRKLKEREREVALLIPEVGSNLVFALPGARTPEEVAGIEGRIVRVRDGIRKVGGISFGASRHMARLVLEVMKVAPEVRSAMNVAYSPEAIERMRALGFRIGSFDRRKEPWDVKAKEGASLIWGVKEVLEGLGEVPDVIYDKGDIGKEPMIRVLGRDPEEVVQKVLEVVRRA